LTAKAAPWLDSRRGGENESMLAHGMTKFELRYLIIGLSSSRRSTCTRPKVLSLFPVRKISACIGSCSWRGTSGLGSSGIRFQTSVSSGVSSRHCERADGDGNKNRVDGGDLEPGDRVHEAHPRL